MSNDFENIRILFENAPVGIFQSTFSGRFVDMNNEMVRILGYSSKDEVLSQVDDIATEIYAFAEERRRILKSIAETNQITSHEIQIKQKGGKLVDCKLSIRPFTINNGEPNYVGILEDLTAFRLAQRKMLENEIRYQSLFDQAADGIVVADADGNVIDVNRSILNITGYTRAEVIGMNVSEFFTPDVLEQKPLRYDLLRQGKTVITDRQMVGKGGRLIDIQQSTSLLPDGKLQTLIRDVTEIRNAERSLKKSEERYREIFESSPAGRLRYSKEGVVLANHKLMEIFGCSTQQDLVSCIQKHGYNLFIDKAGVERSVADLLSNQTKSDIVTIIRPDGHSRRVMVSAKSVYREGGDLDYFDCIFQDVTAEEKLNSDLKKSEKILSSIVNSLPFDLFVTDSRGVVILQNRVSKRYWGNLMATGTMAPTSENPEAWKQHLSKVAQGGTVDFEELIETRSGEKIDARRIIAPLTVDEHELYGAIFLNIDITEQKKLKKELGHHLVNLELLVKKRTEEISHLNEKLVASNVELSRSNEQIKVQNVELESLVQELKNAQRQLVQSEKMASLGVLTAGIAHEINNPINFISSGVVGLSMEVENLMQAIREYQTCCSRLNIPEGKDLLQNVNTKYEVITALENIPKLIGSINTGVERTIAIVKGLRTFSRMDDEVKTLASLNDIINTTLTILYNKYKYRISVVLKFCDNDTISCFPGKLGQVFLNILSNSIHAIQGNGVIQIITEFNQPKQGFTIRIIDTGVGIPASIQQKIFDPFFTTKQVGDGTGLGLSIVHGIIKDHDGEINVYSEEGKGAEFIIFLPKN